MFKTDHLFQKVFIYILMVITHAFQMDINEILF